MSPLLYLFFPAVQHLRTILSLILTNSEVRKLLSDLSVIGRDLLARGATEIAESVRPDRETLASVDEPAPKDEFVTENRQTTGPHGTLVPEIDTKTPQQPSSEIETEAKLTNGGHEDNATQVEQSANRGASGQNGASDSEGKKQGLIDRVRGIRVCDLTSI